MLCSAYFYARLRVCLATDSLLASRKLRALRRGLLILDVARHPSRIKKNIKERLSRRRIIKKTETGEVHAAAGVSCVSV